MKPKKRPSGPIQSEILKVFLKDIVSDSHPLVKLGDMVEWSLFEERLASSFCEDNGRPGLPVRLMVGLHYLKYTYGLSDEAVVEEWVENPYWQYFCGGIFFEHAFPLDPSSMTRWRERLHKAGLEEVLGETIRTGLRGGFIREAELKRVNVDTTVQEKQIRPRMRGRTTGCGNGWCRPPGDAGSSFARPTPGRGRMRCAGRAAMPTRPTSSNERGGRRGH